MTFLTYKALLWVGPALVLALILLVWALRQRGAAVRTLAGIQTNASPWRRKIQALAIPSALLLAAVAVLRPIGGMELGEQQVPARNLVLLMDVSKSMAAVDSDSLSRMEAAKVIAGELVARRPSDRIGLLSFAGGAFPECPTTLDRTILVERINVQKPGGLPVGGTDLEAALSTAAELLTEDPPPGSALLLLSDGDNVTGDPSEVAQTLADRGVRIFAVGLGQPGLEAGLPDGVGTTADHEVLQSLAETTGGAFLEGRPDRMDAVIASLESHLDTVVMEGTNFETDLHHRPIELYAYPVGAALALLFLHWLIPVRSGRWYPLGLAFLALFLTSPRSMAQEAEKAVEAVEAPVSLLEGALALAESEDLPLLLIFTGSDWSEQSIEFRREILEHSVYQQWAERKVVVVETDLRRAGMTREEKAGHRKLSSRFDVVGYPLALFLNHDGTEIGRLGHDGEGPAAWVRRAEAILAGDVGASTGIASIEYLPEHVRRSLAHDKFDSEDRALRHYQYALELEAEAPELLLESKDRRDLLEELYLTAARLAPDSRPDLQAAAEHRLALLEHRLVRRFFPVEGDGPQHKQRRLQQFHEQVSASRRSPNGPALFEKAIRICRRAQDHYVRAAALSPGDAAVSANLSILYRDLAWLEAFVEYVKAHQTAVEGVAAAHDQESVFQRSLDRGVTTARPINDADIGEAVAALDDLIEKAEAVADEPTYLNEEDLADFRLAKEDMDLAPRAHEGRDLRHSRQHIKDALDHLVDPTDQQQPQQGEGEGEEPEGEPNDEGDSENRQGDRPDGDVEEGSMEDGDESERGNSDQKLRRSGKEMGDLRGRLLDRMADETQPLPPGQDR